MYKRGQVEDALGSVLRAGSKELRSDMRIRAKRLLNLDRARGVASRSRDAEQKYYAFYSAKQPGRGYEDQFSDYDAFALLTGLRLMAHGWPQGDVVAVLRRLRPELSEQHARVLRQDPADLFDEAKIVAQARPGDLAVGNTDPVFLVVVSTQDHLMSQAAAVCRGREALGEFSGKYGQGHGLTLFELVNSIHAVASALAETTPRSRGRSPPR